MGNIQKGLAQDARWITEGTPMDHKNVNDVIESLAAYLKATNTSQKRFAEAIGVSPAVVNQLLKMSYTGDVEKVCKQVRDYIAREEHRQRTNYGRPRHVTTTVVEAIRDLLASTENVSDTEGAIGLVIGEAGHGKSVCLSLYAETHTAVVYVVLDKAMGSTAMWSAIAAAIKGVVHNRKIDTTGTRANVTRSIIAALANRRITILLDEASHLTVAQLDEIRQILTVQCRCPVILSGNANLKNTIYQDTNGRGRESLDQFTSRMIACVDLDVLASRGEGDGGIHTESDIRRLFQYNGVKLSSDGVRALRKICRSQRSGRLRTCSRIITALHAGGIVNSKGEIDASLIRQTIEDLCLPVRVWLPMETDADLAAPQQETRVAAAAG